MYLLQCFQHRLDTLDIRGSKVGGIAAPDTTRTINHCTALGNDGT